MKCSHCNGTGETENFTKLYDQKSKLLWQKTKLCLYCLGDGELDWIENLVGKDRTDAGEKIQKHRSTEWCDEGEIIDYEMPSM